MQININGLLKEAVQLEASDLHLVVGQSPSIRLHGKLVSRDIQPLKPEHTAAFAGQILSEGQMEALDSKGEIDLAYSLPGTGRFRVNVFRQKGALSLAIRVLKQEIPHLDELGLPKVLECLALRKKGLLLVTGPTGSGKSTTVAALIGLINRERNCHILTLEDPIEYLHRHDSSLVNQREVGCDTGSFSGGLRAALRQDPDVIFVGEMRDLETISIAITASETGHLVLATLHTSDAPQTIDRIMDVFPPHQQQQIRVQLANSLIGVVSQQLLPRSGGKGRVAATEVLIINPAVRNLIREGKVYQLYSVIQTGGRVGMQLMDGDIRRLYQEALIDYETALEYAADPENLAKSLKIPPG